MADFKVNLPSLISPWVAPIERKKYTAIAGNNRYLFKAGFNSDERKVPNIYQVLFAQFNLTTDATVVNRYPNIRVRSNGIVDYDRLYATAITASDNEIFTVQRLGYALNASPIAVTTAKYVGLNKRALIFSGDEELDCFIDGGVAGDSWTLAITFHCINRELDVLPAYMRNIFRNN